MIKKVLNDRLVNRTRFLGQLKMISYASGRDNGMRQQWFFYLRIPSPVLNIFALGLTF